MSTKRFHIGDIIRVIDGRLVSLNHIDGIYDILNWMTDDNLFTHQLPRAYDECAPTLREAFPDLVGIEIPPISSMEDVQAWMAELEAQGVEMWREVPKVKANDHARIDPVLELQHMVGAEKVITVEVRP